MSKITFAVQDNWKNFQYKSRFLDALASLCQIQGVCAALLEYEGRFYLSYNSSIMAQSKKYLDLIKNILIQSKSSASILGVYLLLNADFIGFLKKDKYHVDGNFKKFLEELIDTIQTNLEYIDENINKILKGTVDPTVWFEKVVAKYFEIFSYQNEANFKTYIDVFFRPLQDCEKLFFHLQHNKYNEIIIIPLDNKDNYHAEYNISIYFPMPQLLDNNYIGISRLSCGYCHQYLDESGYLHRGTHGLCDDEWHLVGPQDARFKNAVKTIAAFKQEVPPPQHRKLSTDEFEHQAASLEQFRRLKNELLQREQYEKKEADNSAVSVTLIYRLPTIGHDSKMAACLDECDFSIAK